MNELADKLLKTIRKKELVQAGDRLAVAVSGGADSVALLLLLVELRQELGIVLSVAHVNHKLRGAESDEDERFVAELAARLGLEFVVCVAPVERKAGAGIESAARRLRHDFFAELAQNGYATKIATAHTLDDQAETVLLRMFRGTGIRGLAGIHPRLRLPVPNTQQPVPSDRRSVSRAQSKVLSGRQLNPEQRPLDAGDWGLGTGCEVVRPVLGFRRVELREFLRTRGQAWREDSSNEDVTFLRNRVRLRLMPVIAEEFGEAAIEHLAELAEIARAEEEQWSVVNGQWPVSTRSPVASTQCAAPLGIGKSSKTTPEGAGGAETTTIDVEWLLAIPLAAARRVVRVWLETSAPEVSISFRLIEEILDLAQGPAGKRLELPCRADADKSLGAGGARPRSVRRARKELVIEAEVSGETCDYEYELPLPGGVTVPELQARIEAHVADAEGVPEGERDGLLDPMRLAGKVLIRNWRAGDRYWPAYTSAERKVKELLADRHVTGVEKKLWPVAVAAGELVWMRGFAAPERWRARVGKAIWIRQIAAMM